MSGISFVRTAGVMSALLVASLLSFPSFSGNGIFVSAPVAVDRSLKGDRLLLTGPEVSPNESLPGTSPAPQSQTNQKAPFGCESAFSPISSPKLANVFRRCMT